ncbi:MAG: DUF5110 domain-containing protein [Candidatus Sumerlaeota bacterium]|nr:DUF5110 domain-containing protein [Candidatus Sumerlaeota bacterium]
MFLSSQSDLRSEPNSVFLAPWAIDPKAAKPTEAFRAAGIAGEQGYTLWGLVLPVGAEAYPSMAAYRRWMQAAVAAPVLLLRAETREETDLSNLPAEALRELQRTRAVRSRLRPVFYNLMREATLKGTPLCAPAQTKEAGAAIRLGPDLVFTVADPEEARGIVHVEMPEGKWVSLRDNRDVSSSHTLDLALAENQMDAFVRAGSILPFWGDLEGAEGPRLVERLYPSESGAFRLYEDAGDGLGYQKGEFAVTTTEWKYDAAKKALAVTIAGPVGDYAEKAMARSLLLQVAMPKQPTAVFLDGKAVERKPYVAGPSQLLEPDPALRLETAEQPAYPLWDHDGAAFLYLWLPQRAAITKVEIYGPPSF